MCATSAATQAFGAPRCPGGGWRDWGAVLRGTLVPDIRFDAAFLATLVALRGTAISPYLFFWQASQEVEEEIARGRKRLWQRRGATDAELPSGT